MIKDLLYHKDLFYAEDYHLYLRIMALRKGDIEQLPFVALHYRTNPKGLSATNSLLTDLRERTIAIKLGVVLEAFKKGKFSIFLLLLMYRIAGSYARYIAHKRTLILRPL